MRTTDELFRSALTLRQLLLDLEPDDHRTRERLLAARMELRAEAAIRWRLHGWRPITDGVGPAPVAYDAIAVEPELPAAG